MPITFIAKCLSNKVLMKPTVTLISEIISLDIFPLVGSGMIPVLHISHIFSPAEYARSQKVSSFVVLLCFRNIEDFVTVLHSQSRFVFKVIASNLENFPALEREMMIGETKQFCGSSGISALLFSPLMLFLLSCWCCFAAGGSLVLQICLN